MNRAEKNKTDEKQENLKITLFSKYTILNDLIIICIRMFLI